MVAEAGAEVLLIGEVRPNADGIEISYRAFRVKGSGTGNVIASSKPRVMAMDWKKELGAAPTQIADTMKEMAEAMKRLAASGGLVSDPKTPADFYHNARMLAQRGEVDLAMSAYEKMFGFPIEYADPVFDMVLILEKSYGKDGAAIYVDKKLRGILSKDVFLLASQLVSGKPLEEIERKINGGERVLLAAQAAFLMRTNAKALFNSGIGQAAILPYGVRTAVFAAVKNIKESYDAGIFQSEFLDPLRSEGVSKEALSILASNVNGSLDYLKEGSRLAYSFNEELYGYSVTLPENFVILDNTLDLKKDVEMCVLDISRNHKCIILSGGQVNQWHTLFDKIQYPASQVPFLCVSSLSWVDNRGNKKLLSSGAVNWDYNSSKQLLGPEMKIQSMEKMSKSLDEIPLTSKKNGGSLSLRGVDFYNDCVTGEPKSFEEVKRILTMKASREKVDEKRLSGEKKLGPKPASNF
jgi:hypothetical protein